MSQGKVIAVKPLGFASDPEVMYARSMETSTSGSSSAGERQGNLVYIEVYEGKGRFLSGRNATSVVWYEDRTGKLKRNDYVEFSINNNRTKPIKGAENVRKLETGKIYLPVDLLSKVALFASLLLLFAVAVDNKR
jgi:hypothetical protein